MRIYNSAVEMVREVERDLWEMGIRVQPETMQDLGVSDNPDYNTVEVQSYGYTLTEWADLEKALEYMHGNLEWAKAEMEDRLSASYINPGRAWLEKRETWQPFLHDGRFQYTYNERFREQLPLVIRELQLHPNTRQAVMTMYDRHQDMMNWGGKARVPCSLSYQFYIRNSRLNLIYVMRSCDFLVHFIHDVYFAVGLLRHIADEVGVGVGNFTHVMGSLHAYEKDMKERGIF